MTLVAAQYPISLAVLSSQHLFFFETSNQTSMVLTVFDSRAVFLLLYSCFGGERRPI